MNHGGRKPRPGDDASDDAFDAKTVVRPSSSSRPKVERDHHSPLADAFGERTRVISKKAAGLPQSPVPEAKEREELKIPPPPPSLPPPPKAKVSSKSKTKGKAKVEAVDESAWDIDQEYVEQGGDVAESSGSLLDLVPRNVKIAAAIALIVVPLFVLTRRSPIEENSTSNIEAQRTVEEERTQLSSSTEEPPPRPSSEGGVSVENVLQEFDQSYFSTQGQAQSR